jgi:hypothetical protein
MDYNNELYGNLKTYKVQDALYLTGELIYKKHFDMILKTWVRAIACIGQYANVCFFKLHDTSKDIVAFIEVEEINISDILKITTKLCILFQNANQYIVFPTLKISELRVKTIDYFSEDNILSEDWKIFFENILPKPINEKEFCLKIISGLVKLWMDKKHTEFRDALEYLCRKNYIIQSIHSETDSNIVSFLWDFMKSFQPDITNTLYILYKTGFKKKDKSWRNTLLYSIHNYINKDYGKVEWSEKELIVINKTISISKELWEYVLSSNNEIIKNNMIHDKTPELYDNLSILENYYPRYSNNDNEVIIEPYVPCKENTKIINIKNKKNKDLKKIKESDKEMLPDDFYNWKYL